MAIAAGLPSPRVMLMDSPGANAAAIGTSPSDACVVVSRRLLDQLNRDQLEGVLGQLIGSIGNGDLRIAFTVTSVFATCGLILALLHAPFGRESRGLLRRVLRYAFHRSPAQAGHAEEADVIASRLARNLYLEEDENDLDRDLEKLGASPWGKFLNMVFLPLVLTGLVSRFVMFIFFSMVLGPCMSLLWRTRRYLADAGAVELTRNPDGLASALEHLGKTDPATPGGAWASHLFVVDPRGDLSLESSPQAKERRAAMAWKASQGGDPDSADPGAVVELSEADMAAYRVEMERLKSGVMRGNLSAAYRLSRFGRVMSRQEPDPSMPKTGWHAASNTFFHPTLKRRLKRLRRMGAHVVLDTSHGSRPKPRFSHLVVGWLLLLLLVPLMLLAAYFLLIAIFVMIMVCAGFMALWMTIIYTVFSSLTHR
jgi:Zn-dependent protease with chaperone function